MSFTGYVFPRSVVIPIYQLFDINSLLFVHVADLGHSKNTG